MNTPVLTAHRGTNADLFPEILRLYAPVGSVIADVTYGRGVFWRNVDIVDYECLFTDIMTGTDCRELPYESESVDVVVLDPPYMHSGGSVKTSLNMGYRVNETALGWRDILPFYCDAITEAARVLRPGGRLLCKCQDTVVNHRQSWLHMDIYSHAQTAGLFGRDLFVLMQLGKPVTRGHKQQHARKNHSFFWVFERPTS